MGKTIIDKILEKHIVKTLGDNLNVIYIDRHLIHEVTSPQAFEGLRKRDLKVACTEKTFATMDHNVPTLDQHLPIKDELSKQQVEQLEKNCKEFNVQLFGLGHKWQGIVHVIGPELGITQPGMTIVCGDSHTSTHGAFGAIAFGIGTSQVEQALATQCLMTERPKTMRINVKNYLNKNVTSKDLALYIISKLGTKGGNGFFVEFAGECIRSLSMEARMTLCNMSIEMGARGGIIAPDEITFAYLKDKTFTKKELGQADYIKTLYSDNDAVFDTEVEFDASVIKRMITFGTSPEAAISVDEKIPTWEKDDLSYMKFRTGTFINEYPIDYVFLGSCTNSRIEDLRLAANTIGKSKIAVGVKGWVVPGSQMVRKQAVEEGLDKIFINAGFEFREPGCSACLGMNDDKIPDGALCVSTSNRNFKGRQGQGARTVLASPVTAVLAAINGVIKTTE